MCLPLCHSSGRSVRQGVLFVAPSVAHIPVADPQQAVADEQSLCQFYPAPALLEFFPVPTARSKAVVLKFEQQNPPEDLLRHILLDALSAALFNRFRVRPKKVEFLMSLQVVLFLLLQCSHLQNHSGTVSYSKE